MSEPTQAALVASYRQGWEDGIKQAAALLTARDDDWADYNYHAVVECARYVALISPPKQETPSEVQRGTNS